MEMNRLKEAVMRRHIELLTELESIYANYICSVLNQKSMVQAELQRLFYNELQRVSSPNMTGRSEYDVMIELLNQHLFANDLAANSNPNGPALLENRTYDAPRTLIKSEDIPNFNVPATAMDLDHGHPHPSATEQDRERQAILEFILNSNILNECPPDDGVPNQVDSDQKPKGQCPVELSLPSLSIPPLISREKAESENGHGITVKMDDSPSISIPIPMEMEQKEDGNGPASSSRVSVEDEEESEGIARLWRTPGTASGRTEWYHCDRWRCDYKTKYRHNLPRHLESHKRNGPEWTAGMNPNNLRSTTSTTTTAQSAGSGEETGSETVSTNTSSPRSRHQIDVKSTSRPHLESESGSESKMENDGDIESKSSSNSKHWPSGRKKAERRMQCPQCPRRFKDRYSLKGHIANKHTPNDEKPFRCDLCDKRFGQNCILRLHLINIHYAEKKQRCTVCSKKFRLKTELKRHCKKVHGM